MQTFEPFGTNWDIAWEVEGVCTGTLSPTVSPATGLTAAGGCPDPFDAVASYKDGDMVRYNAAAHKWYLVLAFCSHHNSQ